MVSVGIFRTVMLSEVHNIDEIKLNDVKSYDETEF